MKGLALGLALALSLMGALALIIASVWFGGPWRWGGAVATAACAAALIIPGIRASKTNKFEETKS